MHTFDYQKGNHTLEYDSLDRLIKAKTWLAQTTYTYDSEHRRISENSTPILWDGQHELGEQNFYRILGIAPFAEIGSAIAICEQGKTLQPLHTVTGDIYQILGRSPLQAFTAFGEGTTSIRWGYQSKTHDPTGLIYFGRRYYDPTSGRFITSDPEGYLDGPNLYAYTLNNPLTHHDPYGLFAYPSNLQLYPQYYGENGFDPNHWKVVGTALYHESLSYARDAALFAGKYLRGFHGSEDMSFADIYAAHLDTGNSLVKKTDSWMASSFYAGSDLYDFTRGATHLGLEIATTPALPFAKIKMAASAGKAILKAEKIAHNSPTLLKTSQIFEKIFQNSRQGSHIKDTVQPIWTSRKRYSSVENAYKHWGDHRKDFPVLLNAKQYVEATHHFTRNPPPGTLRKVRSNGDVIFYHPISNTFAITNKSGVPRTMYKPDPSSHKLSSNLEYFNAQK